jgi:hypothetical protein
MVGMGEGGDRSRASLGLLFYPEDGDSMLLWNTGTYLLKYRASHTRRLIFIFIAVRTSNVSSIHMLHFLNVKWSIIVPGQDEGKFLWNPSSKLHHIPEDHTSIITAMRTKNCLLYVRKVFSSNICYRPLHKAVVWHYWNKIVNYSAQLNKVTN